MPAAMYLWTGSWRTVRVTIDPEGTRRAVALVLAAAVEQHLDVLRLIGEDLEGARAELRAAAHRASTCA